MDGYTSFFDVLSKEAIEEKIYLNKRDWGYSLQQLKEKLEDELAQHKRYLLRLDGQFFMYPIWKKVWNFNKYKSERLACFIQTCNLEEQVAYINNKILKEFTQCQPITQAV